MVAFLGGLTRSRSITGAATGRLRAYPIRNGVHVALYSGDPVRVSSTGVLTLGTNSAAVLGVARQFAWIDKTTGQPQYSKFIPANTSSKNSGYLEGFTSPFALVDDDPKSTWIIRTDTSVSAGRIGTLCLVTLAGTGSTATGRSAAEADVHDSAQTSVSAGFAMFRIMGVYRTPEVTSAGAYEGDWNQHPDSLIEVMFQNHLYG